MGLKRLHCHYPLTYKAMPLAVAGPIPEISSVSFDKKLWLVV